MVKFVVSLRPLCLGAVAFLLCLLVDPLMAQKDGRPTAVAGPISIDAKVRSLTAVFAEIAAQSGARFAALVPDPEPVVTLSIRNGTVRAALEQVAAAANEQVDETRRGVLLLSSSEDAPWKRGPDVLIVWELLRHLSDKQRAELLSGRTLPLSDVPIEAEPRVLDWILRDDEFARACFRDRRRAYVCLSYTPRVILRGEGGASLGQSARIDIQKTQQGFAQRQYQTLERKYLEDPSWPLSKPIPMPEGPIRPPKTEETADLDAEGPLVPDVEDASVDAIVQELLRTPAHGVRTVVVAKGGASVEYHAAPPDVRLVQTKDGRLVGLDAGAAYPIPQAATRTLEEWCSLATALTGQALVVEGKRSQERVFISAGEYTRRELIGILYKCAGLDVQPLAGGGRLLAGKPEALNRPGPVTGDEARAEMLEMLRPLLLSCDAVPVEPFQDEPPNRRQDLTTRYPGYPTGKIVDLGPFSPEEILSRKRCALKELPPEQRAWVAAAVRHSRAHRVLPEVREVQLVPGLTFTVCLADPGGTRKKIEGRPDRAALRERYPGCMIYGIYGDGIYGGGGETWVIDAPPRRLRFQVHWR